MEVIHEQRAVARPRFAREPLPEVKEPGRIFTGSVGHAIELTAALLRQPPGSNTDLAPTIELHFMMKCLEVGERRINRHLASPLPGAVPKPNDRVFPPSFTPAKVAFIRSRSPSPVSRPAYRRARSIFFFLRLIASPTKSATFVGFSPSSSLPLVTAVSP